MAVEAGDTAALGDRRGARRQIVTPEGIALSVDLADLGDRLGALLLDLLLIVGVAVVLAILSVLTAVTFRSTAALAPIVLFFFLGTSAYFLVAELYGQGATLGKRWLGLRVIDRRGAALTPQAIIARNLMRSFELFLPVGMLLAASAGGWGTLALAAWFLLFALMPVFNRDRQRCGDMIAGTWVIVLPKPALGAELLAAPARFTFTDAQLDAYGERELQVLEEVLRREAKGEAEAAERRRLLADIGSRIRRRINYVDHVEPQEEDIFLQDFYSAQRGLLEFKTVTTGRRRKSKHDRQRADANRLAQSSDRR
jgi:uncharacterized RDD family membrane protein YckC